MLCSYSPAVQTFLKKKIRKMTNTVLPVLYPVYLSFHFQYMFSSSKTHDLMTILRFCVSLIKIFTVLLPISITMCSTSAVLPHRVDHGKTVKKLYILTSQKEVQV
jgi:hypothetical protein